jgi:hypothetical protein
MSNNGMNRAKGTQAPVKGSGASGSNATKIATGGKGNAPASRYTRSSANVGGRKR